MSKAKRKTYTPAFRAKVGLDAIRDVQTANQIGQDHGTHPVQVAQWKRDIQERAERLFATKRRPKKGDSPGDADQLDGEIGCLKVHFSDQTSTSITSTYTHRNGSRSNLSA